MKQKHAIIKTDSPKSEVNYESLNIRYILNAAWCN